MSRCTVKTTKPGVHLEVGIDLPCTSRASWFGHAYDSEDGDPIDSLWATRSNYELLEWMNKHGVDRSDAYTESVYSCIGDDLDPSDVKKVA